ncbi:MAG: D-alanyl-D-alanine carboxypeptidase family protein [Acutalibacteraceae bacterium]
MKPLTFTEADIRAGSLILVNAAHPLAEAAPVRCVPVSPDGGGEMLAPSAAAVLRHIFAQIGCGTRILPVSGARTRAEQERLYADSLRDNGEEFTRKYVALPGCSEHETGLAIDLGINEGAVDFIRPAFPMTASRGCSGQLRRAAGLSSGIRAARRRSPASRMSRGISGMSGVRMRESWRRTV